MDGTPASRDYAGGFASRLMVKDLGLAHAAAQHVGMELPMGDSALQLYQQVRWPQPNPYIPLALNVPAAMHMLFPVSRTCAVGDMLVCAATA